MRADKTIDPTWELAANDTVLALVATERTIYVGGNFTRLGSQARRHLAALDTARAR
ncbi:MAG: hypothetical protein K6U89_03350 [Chloroflexi bacterium]|nr:hypothetical protein [Chloroflexota bacterium]